MAIASLALLAPALGGATQLWAQGILLLAFAALLIVAPPRQTSGSLWIVLLLATALGTLPSFLPARWLGLPAWRQALVAADHEVNLPATFSPQPWLSVEAACLLFSGVVFACYLAAQPWEKESRRRALRIYAAGILTLAIVAIISHFIGHKPPFWPRTENSPIDFGFFPNRNQTANVLALGGMACTALAFDAFEKRKRMGWVWLGAILTIGVALVIDYSRAGILLFLGGIAGWTLVNFALATDRKGLALGLAGSAILLTLFFLFGGETLSRFQMQIHGQHPDFRVAIQADAWRLAAKAPWFGQGLANFEPIFAMFRESSAAQNRALHPESDWLWSAVEMGWLATSLLLGAVYLWLRQSAPFSSPGSDRSLRLAGAFCGGAFVLHGIIDVSGHRPGAAWPALFLASLALHPNRPLRPGRWVAPIFRVLGGVLVVIGLWWLASAASMTSPDIPPTTRTLARLVNRLERESAQGAFSEATQTAEESLRIAPLDWRLYYQRAIARMVTSPLPWVATRDFRTARRLEPHWADSCFNEGKLWLSINQPDSAIEAWTEALRRAGGDAPALYSQMLAAAGTSFTMHAALQEMAEANRDYLLVFLHYADRLECEVEIGRLLEADPTLKGLTADQRKLLFKAWFERGDRSLLVTQLRAQPDWMADGWPWLVRSHVENEEFDRAYQIVRAFGPLPALPRVTAGSTLTSLEQQFRYHPDNFQEGLELYSAQRGAGQKSAAVDTLVALQSIPNHPSYVAFLEADLRAELEQWPEAWKAWRRYAGNEFP